jgi:hypothetical protein
MSAGERNKKSDAPRPRDGALTYSLAELDAMDQKFVGALLAAIAAGKEHCTVGVSRRPGTKHPRTLTADAFTAEQNR